MDSRRLIEMIPLGKSTAVLPAVQGVAVGNRGFPITLLQISAPRHLSAVCVSSPSSPVIRNTRSSERRISSVSSLTRELKVYKEQESWQSQSQGLRIQSKSVNMNVASQQIQRKLLIKTTPEKETISSLEMKTEQSIEFNSTGYSSQEDVQASSPSECKQLSKAKSNISLSRTSKSTNKSRKLCKSRKSCKRRNNAKLSRKVPSVFERLTNGTFKNDIQHDREKSKYPSSTRSDITMFHKNEACGTLLEITQLQAAYSTKKSSKKKTLNFLLLPRVPKLTKFENNSTRTTIKKEPSENIKSDNYNNQVVSPKRQKSLQMNSNREENIVSCKKVYLSEMQSKAIGGVPSAPPGTPSSDQLKKIEYVPSLMDIKSQRAIKSKLEKIVHKLRIEEQHRKENSIKQDQKKVKESLIQLKQRQRLEVYALNKVMTELENENFKKFMDKKEAVSLGV